MLAFNETGHTKVLSCVYHGWSYSLQGDLVSVPFKDGIKGSGGMASSFRMEAHGPRKLRVAVVHGLVFGTLSEDVPPIEEYLGEPIMTRLGRFLQAEKPLCSGASLRFCRTTGSYMLRIQETPIMQAFSISLYHVQTESIDPEGWDHSERNWRAPRQLFIARPSVEK